MKKSEKNKNKQESLKAIEEKLTVDKEKIETGKVRLTKKVHEEEIPLELSSISEEIEVEVKKIGKVINQPGEAVRTEGDSTVYSVYKEVLVKQTILEEEVWLTRKKSVHPVDKKETLRREEIIVERFSEKEK